MTDEERQRIHDAAFDSYRTMFASMSAEAKASWFFISDESVLLSFEVRRGESPCRAELRHAVKLNAMADALESLPTAATDRGYIDDLRRLACGHGFQL